MDIDNDDNSEMPVTPGGDMSPLDDADVDLSGHDVEMSGQDVEYDPLSAGNMLFDGENEEMMSSPVVGDVSFDNPASPEADIERAEDEPASPDGEVDHGSNSRSPSPERIPHSPLGSPGIASPIGSPVDAADGPASPGDSNPPGSPDGSGPASPDGPGSPGSPSQQNEIHSPAVSGPVSPAGSHHSRTSGSARRSRSRSVSPVNSRSPSGSPAGSRNGSPAHNGSGSHVGSPASARSRSGSPVGSRNGSPAGSVHSRSRSGSRASNRSRSGSQARSHSGSPAHSRSGSPTRSRSRSGSPARSRSRSGSPVRSRSGSPARSRSRSGSPARSRSRSVSPVRSHSGSPARSRSGSPARSRSRSGSPPRSPRTGGDDDDDEQIGRRRRKVASDDEGAGSDKGSAVGELIADIFGSSDEEEEFEGFGNTEADTQPKKDKKKTAHAISDDENQDAASVLPELSDDDDDAPRKQREDFVSDFELMLQRKKEEMGKRRKRRKDVDLINDNDDLIDDLIRRMRQAAEEDRNLNEARKPAVKKLQMLPKVISQLKKADLHNAFLDGGVLNAITDWLAPLPDKSLPHLQIREAMLKQLMEFPSISTEGLKLSGIGKAVMYLYKHPKEQRPNKDVAGKLINEWSRPIFNLTSNYKNLTREEREQRDYEQLPKKRRISLEGGATPRRDIDKAMVGDDKVLRPGDPGYVYRARVPQPSHQDYVIRPKWNVEEKPKGSSKKPVNKFEQHMRAYKRKAQASKMQRAVTMSIEGRNMSI